MPSCYYWERKEYTIKEICEHAPERNYTDVMIFRENRRKINELILIHLPYGPTAIFKVSSVMLRKGNYFNLIYFNFRHLSSWKPY